MTFDFLRKGADVEGPYRYRLWREWAPERGSCCFVMHRRQVRVYDVRLRLLRTLRSTVVEAGARW